MSKVKEYMILSATETEELERLVNEQIAEGWKPLKGPFVFSDSICQAMILKEPKERRIKLKNDRLRKNSDDGVV